MRSKRLVISMDLGNGKIKVAYCYYGDKNSFGTLKQQPTVFATVKQQLKSNGIESLRVPTIEHEGELYTFGDYAYQVSDMPRAMMFNQRYDSVEFNSILPAWIVGSVIEQVEDFDAENDEVVIVSFLPPYVFNRVENNMPKPLAFAKNINDCVRSFKFNGQKYKVKIPKMRFGNAERPAIFIMPEGLAAAQTLLRDISGRIQSNVDAIGGLWVVVDLGAFTADIVELINFDWSRDGNFFSEPNRGVITHVIQPMKRALDEANLPFSGMITTRHIEESMPTGFIQIGNNKWDVSDYLRHFAGTYWDDIKHSIIFSLLKDLKPYRQVVFVGGGSDFLRKWGDAPMSRDYGTLVFSANDAGAYGSTANAIGGLKYAMSKIAEQE